MAWLLGRLALTMDFDRVAEDLEEKPQQEAPGGPPDGPGPDV